MRIKNFVKLTGDIIPQITGSDGEDDDDDDGQDGEGSGQGGHRDDDDDEDDDGNDGDGDDRKKIHRLSRENGRHRNENKKLKQRLEELEAQREDDSRKRQTKLERAQEDLKKNEIRNRDLSSTNEALLLENAVLKDSKHKWHDSSAVIALLDKGLISVDPESGSIEGIEDALADLAKDKPFLVKSAERNNQGNGSSGGHPGGGSRQNQRLTEEQRLNDVAKKWKLGR